MAQSVYVGTSGWSYKAWAKTFYPAKLRATEHLAFYARHFPTVEINASFYRLPTLEAVTGWHDRAPDDFVFAIKGSRAVTHFKKLLPGAKSYDLFLERARGLQEHLGPILWQLPGKFQKNSERLAAFVEQLPGDLTHAIEFRHPSWLDDEVFAILRRRQVAHVCVSSLQMPADLTRTAPFVYIRFHGLKGGAAHDYTAAELRPWAEFIRECAVAQVPSFVYFNNDLNTRAPWNAKALMETLGSAAVQPRQDQ